LSRLGIKDLVSAVFIVPNPLPQGISVSAAKTTPEADPMIPSAIVTRSSFT
jgi:hypothetical protein